jgi:hypothetical protein
MLSEIVKKRLNLNCFSEKKGVNNAELKGVGA